MFIAVYRWTLKPEAQFEKDWAEVTRCGVEDGKSLGSTLGRAPDGSWVAVARWPSKQQRDEWFASCTGIEAARERMRAAYDRRFDDLEIEVTADLAVGLAR